MQVHSKRELIERILDRYEDYFEGQDPKGLKMQKRALETLLWSIATHEPRVDLLTLFGFSNQDFMHDLYEMQASWDPKTHEFKNLFCPRCWREL